MTRRIFHNSNERCCICVKKLDKSHRPLPVGFDGFHHISTEAARFKNQRLCSNCARKHRDSEKVQFLIFQANVQPKRKKKLHFRVEASILNQALKFSESDLPRLEKKKKKKKPTRKKKKKKKNLLI